MPREFPRSLRVAEQLQRDLGEYLRAFAQNERLGLLSVSEVRVSPDLSHATVMVSILGNDDADTVMTAVAQMGPQWRHLLARSLRLKKGPPQLHFHHDRTLLDASHMDNLIDAAVREDRSHHHGQE